MYFFDLKQTVQDVVTENNENEEERYLILNAIALQFVFKRFVLCTVLLIAYFWLIIDSQSLADVVRGLDFLQWMDMLEKVFSTSVNVLKRMQVQCYSQTLLKRILREPQNNNVHINMGPVVRTPVSVNPRLNLTWVSFFFFIKSTLSDTFLYSF